MIAALTWIGGRAKWLIFIGAFAGLAFPAAAATLRPALPFLIAWIYAVSMLRIDPISILAGLRDPRRIPPLLATVLLMLVATPALAFALARGFGLGPDIEGALVYTLAAPPIGSAAAICLIIGFRGRDALELAVIGSLAMPFTGPMVTGVLIGDALDIDPFALGGRMAAMIFGGFALAMIGRRLLGEARINRNAPALDGVAAATFLLFAMPLFDGVGPLILAEPGLSLVLLSLGALLILGAVALALRLPGARDRNGALGVVWGTRSVAIYLAALPPDPVFTLYVALYQFPMAALALAFRRRE